MDRVVSGRNIPQFLFLCEAGPGIGGGHVMRCLTLAHEIRRAGVSSVFACTRKTVDIVPELTQSGFEILLLSEPFQVEELAGLYNEWLPVPPVATVVDHYGWDARQEQVLRRFSPVVVVIDDLANRPHDCDLLLDQTFGRRPDDYLGLVPAKARLLTGSEYALVRPSFVELRSKSLARRSTDVAVRRLLVSLGMTDVDGMTRRVVQAVADCSSEIGIDIAVGPATSDMDALQAVANRYETIKLHVATSEMAELMSEADLAIGAAGGSSWERCCLGLPTLMLVLADNQRVIATQLDEIGAARSIDPANLDQIPAIVRSLRDHPKLLRRMSRIAASVVDGLGTKRVAAVLLDLSARRSVRRNRLLSVRQATAADRLDVWLWRNHESARRHSGINDEIPFSDHSLWWDRKLSDPDTILLIIEVDGQPIGQVRFDGEKQSAEASGRTISIALAPDFQGLGYGAPCLSQAIAFYFGKLKKIGPLLAEVHPDNVASIRVFERCGFERSHLVGEFIRYELARSLPDSRSRAHE